MSRLPVVLLAFVSVSACLGLVPDRWSGDVTVFVNADVWTGDVARPTADAFAVQNGTFVFVGDEATARDVYRSARIEDLGGRRVVPGLIDSHTHFVHTATEWGCQGDNPFLPALGGTGPQATADTETFRAQKALEHYQTNLSGLTPVDDTIPIADMAAAKRGIACAEKLANAMGLTMTVEAGTPGWDFLTVLQEMEGDGSLTLRQSLYLTPPQLGEAISRRIHNDWGTDMVRVAGIKFYSDGWLGPRTAALLEPYSDRPASRGVLFLEQSEADDWIGRALDAGLKPSTHAIGDQGASVVLATYAKHPGATTPGIGPRFTLEHASILSPRLITQIAQLRPSVSYQMSFATSDQAFVESALGPERAKYTYAWNTLEKYHLELAGGSDFPNEVLPPLWGLQRVVTRQELDGTPPGGWHPDERLSIEEALRSVTIGGAYNVGMQDRVGSITEGKLADFVVLDQDILTIDPQDIAKTCVRQTWVGGRLVHDGERDTPCAQVAYQPSAAGQDARDEPLISAVTKRF